MDNGTSALPRLLTVDQVAAVLQTSRKAIYTMHARAQLPGAVHIGRRLLFAEADLIDWLGQKFARHR